MAPPRRPPPLRAAAAAVAAALPRSAEAASWTTLGGLNCWDGDKGGIRIEEANYDNHNPVHDEGERLEELSLDECKARCAADDVCQGVLTIHRHILPGEPDKGPCWLRKSLQPSKCMPDTPWDLHVLSDRSFFSASSFGAASVGGGGFDCTAGVELQEVPKYVGCYVDDSNRVFNQGPMAHGYTVFTCDAACAAVPTTHMALQDDGQCFCGSVENLGNAPYLKVADGQCGEPSATYGGASAPQRGGGYWRNAVYTGYWRNAVYTVRSRGWSDQKRAYCCDHDGVGCGAGGQRGWLAASSAAAGAPQWMLLLFIVLVFLPLCLLVCLLFQAGCFRCRAGGKAASGDAPPAPAVAQGARKDSILRLGVAGGSLSVDAPGYGPMVVSQSHRATADSWEYGRRPAGQPLTSAWPTSYSTGY